MKKTKTKILTVLVLILLAGIYYYVKLPAINIHADGFWMFLLVVIAAVAVFYIGRRRLFRNYTLNPCRRKNFNSAFELDRRAI